jgi:hypothetical protein
MNTYYMTGRDYGIPQVLEITAPDHAEPFDLVDVDFVDAARGITGSVKVFGMELDSESLLGRAVLNAYDLGMYSLR